jgi:hypothetical protein
MSLSAVLSGVVTDVEFKDLCLDTTRPDDTGPFWRDLLGLSAARQSGGDWSLTGPTPQQGIWVNTVPEPKTAKSRVHVDVRVEGEAPGVLVHHQPRWTVMTDPDGLEWCAFPPRERSGVFELVVDAGAPQRIAQWWADRLGATVHNDGEPWWWLEGAAGFPHDSWVFQPVPEPKTVKNRMHWDVVLRDATVEDLEAAGARVLDRLASWTVLADPEGNEFCAFPPPRP